MEKVLTYFRNEDKFTDFKNDELRDYQVFKKVILDFRKVYQLQDFDLKQIDQYLWQFGKDVFPKQYGKKKVLKGVMVNVTIDKFLDNLRRIEDTDNMKNPYLNSIQVENLFIYLSQMIEVSPKALFVGEAPGYLGCALTGIPFTDEYRLTSEGSVGCLPLLCSGYVIVEQNCFSPHKETSASVMWSSFVDNSFFPMLWNIFPFHPHKKGNIHSNRTPTLREIKEHICFMNDVMTLLPSIKCIYAVGRKAEDMLSRIGIEADYIRHPSHGGAKECRERVGEIAKRG